MTYSVTVAIPYVEEFPFLVASLREIQRLAHLEIETEVIVVDQSGTDDLNSTIAQYQNVKHVKTNRIDAGYPLEVAARQASGQYFCSLDADAFPISSKWLYLPVKLIEEFGLSFVGKNTGLHVPYAHAGPFFHINNYYRVCKTSLAKSLAERVGFCRYRNRDRTGFVYQDLVPTFDADCDNGVVSQWFSDQINAGPKLSLALNKILGMTTTQGVFGMTIDDMIFHFVFGFGREWIKDFQVELGTDYLYWRDKIYRDGVSPEMVEEIKASLKPHHSFYDREYWDSDSKAYHSLTEADGIFKRIEELKA